MRSRPMLPSSFSSATAPENWVMPTAVPTSSRHQLICIST